MIDETPIDKWANEFLKSVLGERDSIGYAAHEIPEVDEDSSFNSGGLLINISANEGYDREAVDNASLRIRRALKEFGIDSETADDPALNVHEWKEHPVGYTESPYVEIYTEEITGEAMRRSDVSITQ